MNIDRYLMIKTAKKGNSSTALTSFSDQGTGLINRLNQTYGALGRMDGVDDTRSMLKRYDQAQNAGLAMALGYGNKDRKLRQALAIGGIGAGAAGGGALGFFGGRAAADALGLNPDSSLARRIGRYALMTGGTLGGAGIGGSLAAAGVGAGLGDYNVADALYAQGIADRAAWGAQKFRGEGKGIIGSALLNAKRRLGEGITLANARTTGRSNLVNGLASVKNRAVERIWGTPNDTPPVTIDAVENGRVIN